MVIRMKATGTVLTLLAPRNFFCTSYTMKYTKQKQKQNVETERAKQTHCFSVEASDENQTSARKAKVLKCSNV